MRKLILIFFMLITVAYTQSSNVYIFDSQVDIESHDTQIQGVQMTIAHGEDFTLDLTEDVYIGDSNTQNNVTAIILIGEPGTSLEGKLFDYSGDMMITDAIIAMEQDGTSVEGLVNLIYYSDCDVNLDTSVNVVDVVLLVNMIFDDINVGNDINQDGVINVVDVILVINLIFYESISDGSDDDGDDDGGNADDGGGTDGGGNGDSWCDGVIDNCGICNGNNDCLVLALTTANLMLENTLVNLYASDVNCCSDENWDWECCYDEGPDSDSHPSEIDFTQAYNSYMYALLIDPEDPNANFGAALTGFLMVTQDPILWDILEQIENYNGWLMPADDSYGRNMVSSTIKSGNPMSVTNLNSMLNFNILNYIPLRQVIGLSNSNGQIRDFTPPPFVQFQDMIDDVFIMRLSQSIEYLDNTVGKDFQFTITPQMQGDGYQEAMQMDDTEFYALKATLHMLRAMLSAINTAWELSCSSQPS